MRFGRSPSRTFYQHTATSCISAYCDAAHFCFNTHTPLFIFSFPPIHSFVFSVQPDSITLILISPNKLHQRFKIPINIDILYWTLDIPNLEPPERYRSICNMQVPSRKFNNFGRENGGVDGRLSWCLYLHFLRNANAILVFPWHTRGRKPIQTGQQVRHCHLLPN